MGASVGRPAMRWGRALLDLLYPPVCPICYQRLTPEDHTFCFQCEGHLVLRPDWRCARCGGAGLGSGPAPGRRCRLCPPAGAPYQGILSVVGYSAQASRGLFGFKYRRRIEMGEALAHLMARALAEPLATLGGRIDCVAPVPLHWRRRMWRGFNQSDRLAHRLAATHGLTYAPRLLRRHRYTRRQALLPPEERAANVADAFRVRRSAGIEGLGVLVVDDVLTSGHTIGECARVLRDAGAREVWGASFFRVGMSHPDMED